MKIVYDDVLLMRASLGYVKRFHVVPHHSKQTIGEHSAQVLNLLFMLHPDPSIHLVWAVLYHDAPERVTGDAPATAKRHSKLLKDALDALEIDFFESFPKLEKSQTKLSENDKAWAHALDVLELWLWCYDEIMMGSQHASVLLKRVDNYLKTDSNIPEEILDFIERAKPRSFV